MKIWIEQSLLDHKIRLKRSRILESRRQFKKKTHNMKKNQTNEEGQADIRTNFNNNQKKNEEDEKRTIHTKFKIMKQRKKKKKIKKG